ncbi:MAG: FRG domain-containing protein [Defluviicoccus sp.]
MTLVIGSSEKGPDTTSASVSNKTYILNTIEQLRGFDPDTLGKHFPPGSATESGDSRFYDEVWLHSYEDYLRFASWISSHLPWSFRGVRSDEFDIGIRYKCFKDGEEIISDDNDDFSRVFYQFKNRCLAFTWPDIQDWDDWRWMFFAQHEGLKTRLLDWTTSPIVALYFAVEKVVARRNDGKIIGKNEYGGDFGTVWCLSVDRELYKKPENMNKKPKDQDAWVMIDPPHINSRLVRQAGKFTFHPHRRLIFDDTMLTEKGIMVKIVLKHAKDRQKKMYRNPAAAIRWNLAINNINYATLFHDIESIAKHLNDEWLSIGRTRSLQLLEAGVP